MTVYDQGIAKKVLKAQPSSPDQRMVDDDNEMLNLLVCPVKQEKSIASPTVCMSGV